MKIRDALAKLGMLYIALNLMVVQFLQNSLCVCNLNKDYSIILKD